jgi:hypothetical protein
MKHILLTCCILAAALSHANAQLSKSDFTRNINALNTAITQKNFMVQKTTFDQLSMQMSGEINFLHYQIKPLQAKYVADTTQAGLDKRKAFLALKAATMPGTSAANVQLDKSNAAIDTKSATQETAQAAADLSNLQPFNKNLEVANLSYYAMLPLKIDITGNKAQINSALNSFASILQ